MSEENNQVKGKIALVTGGARVLAARLREPW